VRYRRRFGDDRRRSDIRDTHRQLHRRLTNCGIGIDPSNANSWPLRSPGILSRRAPCGFLPLGQQLLDQPSPGMRIPGHQLNDQSWSKGHARRGDRLHPRRFLKQLSCIRSRFLGKHLGIATESPAPPDPHQPIECEAYCANWDGPRNRRRRRVLNLPFLRHVAQIVIVRPSADPAVQAAAPVVSSFLERAATIRCIMAMNRFWSTLLRSATVSR
jgi:hypothetical protein